MLLSLSLIIIIGFALSGIFKHFKLPGLLGMIITGIVLGPYALDLISQDILNISSELRKIALIVILMRAGLTIDLNDLKKVGRPAILMCFIPASFEIVAITLIAPILFQITHIEAAILGTVLAAVSPAVVVPRMISLIENGYGKAKSIPQLIMAGSSVDDIYVIVLFTSFLGMYSGKAFEFKSLLSVPLSILAGVILGALTGILLVNLFKKIHMRDTVKVLLILSTCFLFVTLESYVAPYFSISGLIAVMALGAMLSRKNGILSKRLTLKFSKVWVASEVLLFVLVGASVDLNYASKSGSMAIILILSALCFRILGVILSLSATRLNLKEKLFCAIAYLPKATVQAAIGAVPLAQGVSSGALILSVAVISILITAPLGAIGIDKSYNLLLEKS
ncbi:MAG: cation:proton antiporter [Proteocatella sp.]